MRNIVSIVCIWFFWSSAATAATVGSTVPVELPDRIDLYVGDSRVLPVRTRRIAVGNGKVLTVSPVASGQLVLIGQGAGSTVVNLWTTDGQQHRISVTVAPNDVETTLSSVRGLLGGVAGVTARVSVSWRAAKFRCPSSTASARPTSNIVNMG